MVRGGKLTIVYLGTDSAGDASGSSSPGNTALEVVLVGLLAFGVRGGLHIGPIVRPDH